MAAELTRVLAPGGYLVISVEHVPSGFTDPDQIQGILTGGERIQTLDQIDELFLHLERVAGFTPLESHSYGQTIAAYRKPRDTRSQQ